MASIAVVLGAGDAVEAAYHIGTLAALAERTGWDARAADLVVGTSAGAGVGAPLRLGVSALDQYTRSQGESIAETRYVPSDELTFPQPPAPGVLDWRPSAPWLLAPALWTTGIPRLGLLAGLLPSGRVDAQPLADRVRALMGDGPPWPADPLWICAVRMRDGRRVVFGREDIDIDVAQATQASSAVPGRLAPVDVGGDAYLDGGMHSSTNADLVTGLGFDLAVVVAPRAATPDAFEWSPDGLQRRYNTQRLHGEVNAVESRGTRVMVMAPTRADLRVMGSDLDDAERARAVAAQAFTSAQERWDRGHASALLARLRSPSNQL